MIKEILTNIVYQHIIFLDILIDLKIAISNTSLFYNIVNIKGKPQCNGSVWAWLLFISTLFSFRLEIGKYIIQPWSKKWTLTKIDYQHLILLDVCLNRF